MDEEIKLGFYKLSANENIIEVIAIRGDTPCCFQQNKCFTVYAGVVRQWEYLGTELPKKGGWVDFDPATTTCDQFPIAGRASDAGHDWIPCKVVGYVSGQAYPFLGIIDSFKLFQVWEAEQ